MEASKRSNERVKERGNGGMVEYSRKRRRKRGRKEGNQKKI